MSGALHRISAVQREARRELVLLRLARDPADVRSSDVRDDLAVRCGGAEGVGRVVQALVRNKLAEVVKGTHGPATRLRLTEAGKAAVAKMRPATERRAA